MKKLVLIRALFILAEIYLIYWACTGFYKTIPVSFPDKRVEVKTGEYSKKYIEIYSKENESNSYRIHISKRQAEQYTKYGYYTGYWYEKHLTLHAFFWIFVISLFVYNLWSIISLHVCLYNYSNKKCQVQYWDCDFCQLRCDLYNDIIQYNTTPIKKEWYKFWGYE